MWQVDDAGLVARRLAACGVLVLPWGGTTIRAVLHSGIDEAGIDHAIDAVGRV